MTGWDGVIARRVILGGLGAGAAGIVSTQASASSRGLGLAGRRNPWPGSRSDNNWPIGAPAASFKVEGTDHEVTLAKGACVPVLLHALRRINYELDTLRKGDVVGLRSDRRVESPQRSNLLSGTAVHFRQNFFPYGTTGNLFPDEAVVLEDIVAESKGVLGWGGHLRVPDQGLIYVVAGPSSKAVLTLRDNLFELDRMDTAGGAGAINPFSPPRRRAAKEYRNRTP